MSISYKEILPQINTFIFDVDGVFTDGSVHILDNGKLARTMNAKDGYAVICAVEAGYKVCVISGGDDENVRTRFERLGVTDIYLGTLHKTIQFNELLSKYNLKSENVLYMGDDLPDFPVMELVGLPCCPKDAVPEIHNISKYISHKNGGKGCVRDVIEQVMKVQDKWNKTIPILKTPQVETTL